MVSDWVVAGLMVLSAGLVVLACLVLSLVWSARQADLRPSLFAAGSPGTAFLFNGDRLLDASPQARALLQGPEDRAFPRLMQRLGPVFPGLAEALDSLPDRGMVLVPSAPDVVPPMVLRGEHVTGLTRLTLVEGAGNGQGEVGDVAMVAALQQEVVAQRAILSRAPMLIWREDVQGVVVWANHAYLIRATELLPEGCDLTWPLPRLFDPPGENTGQPRRLQLKMPGGAEWFDLVHVENGADRLFYATAANGAVQAETALREFMQTLTKTFADLPIGLAIFDRSRILQLFNPALADLTSLPPEFLISRPSLNAVLDAMRAKAMIPEPKDYRSWRRQIARLEEEAALGLFEETWSLPGGQTYRVIGRPHPNGALAFMFEDISHEMTRTRRYRADLELGQSVIDSVEEAVAVFSHGGQLVMSNLAYARLWGHDPAVMLSDAGIATLCAWWRDHSAPTLLWDDAMEFVTALGDRTPWEGDVRLLDGRLVFCRFRPLDGGSTLVTFRDRLAEPAPGPAPARLSA